MLHRCRAIRARRVDFYNDIPYVEGVTTWLNSRFMTTTDLIANEDCAGGFPDASWRVRSVVHHTSHMLFETVVVRIVHHTSHMLWLSNSNCNAL